MKKAILFLADGFEEIEAVSVIDLLRRASIELTIAGVTGPMAVSARGLRVMADIELSKLTSNDYDAFILPGGPGFVSLQRSKKNIDMLLEGFNAGKLICAICAAPTILAKMGILDGRNYTVFPSMRSEIKTGTHKECSTVTDGNVITGNGPGAASEFAFAIVAYLLGQEKSDELRKGTLFA